MPSYRVYMLNRAGRILAGEWIDAETDEAAGAAAQAMYEEAPAVEVWRGAKRIAVLPAAAIRSPEL